MPELSGLDVAAHMARWPEAPRVVFLTVHDDPEFVAAARLAGAAGYVLKGCMATDLVPAVRRALGDPGSGPSDRQYDSPLAPVSDRRQGQFERARLSARRRGREIGVRPLRLEGQCASYEAGD
jgi:DNA-binding NarL/FixJ family response regulator